MPLLRSLRRSSALRLFRVGRRHDIVKQRSSNLWWRPQRRSARLVPERTSSGMKPDATASESSEKQCSSSFPCWPTTRHRQTEVIQFVVASPATFGTACPRADKQWHEARCHCFGVFGEAVLFVFSVLADDTTSSNRGHPICGGVPSDVRHGLSQSGQAVA